jgi:2-iminobutanoate/2-iminopropanoate deaminase
MPPQPTGEALTASTDGNTANFSAAVRAGGFIFVSGQASVDDAGQIVSGTFAEEMTRSIANVERVLATYELTLAAVVKVNAFVGDPADLVEYNQRYTQHFSPPRPARTTITGCLPSSIKFEIDVIAVVNEPADYGTTFGSGGAGRTTASFNAREGARRGRSDRDIDDEARGCVQDHGNDRGPLAAHRNALCHIALQHDSLGSVVIHGVTLF